MKPKQVTVAGVVFPSIKSACERFGVSLQTTARRLRNGWTPEQAVGIAPAPKRRHDGTELTTTEGVFRSITAASEHFGVEAALMRDRLAKGWSTNEAVGVVPRKRPAKHTTPIECAGERFPNVSALAAAHHLGDNLVRKRIRSGWTSEQAVGLHEPPPRFRNQVGGARTRHWKSIDIVDGKEMPGGEAGEYKLYLIRNRVNGREYVGITVTPLWQRLNGHRANARKGVKGKFYNAMRHYGFKAFSIELVRNDARSFGDLQRQEIAEISRRDTVGNGYNTSPGGSVGTSKSMTVAGVFFSSHAAAASHYGIDPKVFNVRLSSGWTPEQAAEIEPRVKFARRRVTLGGRAFPSLKAAAEHFGVDYKLAHDRHVGKNWSVEQALGLAPPPSRQVVGLSVEAFGERFPSINAAARRFGIKGPSLRLRIVEMGEKPERAIRHLLALEARRTARRAK